MKFQESVIELIKRRNSCRSYENQEIELEKAMKLNSFISGINAEASEASIKTRFQLVTNRNKSDNVPEKLGTYGFISGADTFIIGITDRSEQRIEIFGYLFEEIILFATELGLGTCWLGGSFNRADFKRKADLTEGEFIPIISPVGYARDRRTIMDNLIRFTAGSDKRKAWDELFFHEAENQKFERDDAGAYATPLEMIQLGPSASNKQPWRVIKDHDDFHIYLSRTRGYQSAGFDMQMNDIGIAMCHFELAAQELNLPGNWRVFDTKNNASELQYVATWTI